MQHTATTLKGSAISIRLDMVFLIRRADPKSADFVIGPHGSELAWYIPPGIQWTQINYGQGEGQVEIDGREWGFYWHNQRALAVVLHKGEIDPEQAFRFVRAVAEKVTNSQVGFELLLAGTLTPDE